MNETTMTLNNLLLDMSDVRATEKKMNDLSRLDETTVADLKKIQMDLQYKAGKFDEAFKAFLKKEGLPDQFHLIDVVAHFWNKAQKTLVIAS